MGLLDALVPYSDGGGLLDFLKRNAMSQSFPSGLPSDQAQYDAPQMPAAYAPSQVQAAPLAPPQQQGWNSSWPQDNMQWPQGPIGAPTAAASPAPVASPAPQMPAAAPVQAPQMPDAGNGWSNFFNRGADALSSLSKGGTLLGAVRGQYDDPQSQQSRVSNMTARALIAKGVEPQVAIAAVAPGNTEMLKQLVDMHFGAPKAPTALGSGYIYNPQTNKVERAYEPDDKIPVGFQKTDNGLQPIPGGPADPAYLRAKEAGSTDPNAVKVLGKGGELYKLDKDGNPVVVHRNQDAQGEATLSDESTKAMAAQYLSGDRTVLQNLGRGAQGAANIIKLREEITKQSHDAGLSAKDVVNNFNEQAGALAGQRSIGTRAANISLAANEANNMIPIALEASAKVPRGEWMPWNKMVQAYQTGTSSPELARFVAATNSLVNSYVRAVSPSGVPTDSMREHAYSMLNSAQSQQAYEAVTKIMQDEMKAAMAAPGQVRKELRHEDAPEGSAASPSFNDRFTGSASAAPVVIDGYKIKEH